MAGPQMSVQSKARECAKTVLSIVKNQQQSNWRYNAVLFARAMYGHMGYIETEGLTLRPEVAKLVQRANEAIREHCDGKDCSFSAIDPPVPNERFG